MSEELLEYYERELTYLRQMGGEFARKYPRVAGRLLLDGDSCEDPHVERLLEGFALMAARVHRRLDDDLPETSEALLNMIYPAYLRPIPAMTVVECLSDPSQGKKTAGTRVPRGTMMVTRNMVDGLSCRFQTAYDVDLWPFAVAEAEWRQPERLQQPARSTGEVQAVAVARLRLKCFQDVAFEGLPLDTLRFYLSGDPSVVYNLYEMISAHCIEVQLRDPKDRARVISLGCEHLSMAGFGKDESVIPHERRSAEGHRLLQEYFALPEKFLFFDLSGLEVLTQTGFKEEAEILFLFSRFERPERQQVMELGVSARTFRLGCTPVVNLFPQTAEPILLTQTKHAYTVIPDGKHTAMMEVFSVDEVVAANPKLRQSVVLEPVYAHRHQTRVERAEKAFWSASRHSNQLGEREPSTLTVSIVDLEGQMRDPEADVLTVRCTCSNFDLPSRFTFGTGDGDLEAPGFAAAKTINVLRRPTPSFDPPSGKGQIWRLVSLLSLNYLSLTEEGKTALQEILRLHNFSDSSHLENHIGSILEVKSSPCFALVESDYGLVPARGTQVSIEFDEQQFAGGGVYLLGAVLDRFFGGICLDEQLFAADRADKSEKGGDAQMATASGHEGAVIERDMRLESDGEAFRMLRQMLQDEPFSVHFFQAVRILERMEKGRGGVGHFAQPPDETMRFTTRPSLSFPPSELYDLERSPTGQLQMTVQFMGLCAALSALPSVYTELVMTRLRDKDGAMADFFDIFNHRLISFFYRAWEKNHFFVGLEAGKDDPLSLRLLDVLGLGTEDMRNRAGIADRTCIYYAGLLGRQVRTADSLRQILEDYFAVPVDVNQFAGTWRSLPKENRTFLTGSKRASERLGFGVVAGEEVWDHHGRIRISLGPLDFEQYGYFLPGESGYRDLAGWVQFYSDGAYETEVQLILKREEVPACELGGRGAETPRLGLVSWLKTRPKVVDAREATYLLM